MYIVSMPNIDLTAVDWLNLPDEDFAATCAAQDGEWCAEWMATRRVFRDARIFDDEDDETRESCEKALALASSAAIDRARSAWRWGIEALGITENEPCFDDLLLRAKGTEH